MELDFMSESFSVKLEDELKTINIALAADGKWYKVYIYGRL